MDVTTRFEYDPPVVRAGRGAVAALGAELARHGLERALVVCGRTVGSTPAVIDPVEAGLGDRLAATFAETTPDKRLETAIDAARTAEEHDADCLVGVGGGSSLDVATVASVARGRSAPREALLEEFAGRRTLTVPSAGLLPVVAVPTTLAGAELSFGAGITGPRGDDGRRHGGGVSHPDLMPTAVVHDPAIVETTPTGVLAGSAMNGFDKGIERLYSPAATPVTDATAARGLARLARWLPHLGDRSDRPAVMEGVLEGVLLVQYGGARPDATSLSIIHALGHGITATVDVQQGIAHAVMAPATLRWLFERVDGRRDRIAAALGVDRAGRDREGVAEAVVAEVERVRDALGMPARLREVDGLGRDDLASAAQHTADDALMDHLPSGLEADEAALLELLEAAW